VARLETVVDGLIADVTLRDGTTVRLRRAVAEDKAMLEQFLNSLSEETVSLRFLESPADRRALLRQVLPGPDNYVLVAIKDDGVIVGHSAYYKSSAESAEVGLTILDEYQGKGLGTIMVEKIARAANLAGIFVFETIISWENTRMVKMVRSMGFPTAVKVEPDLIRIRFPTSIDPVTIEEFHARWGYPVPS
jgi:acetate---CoA ligase (ADP-forming)